MATRSLISIFYKRRFVVAQYSQFDGYPEGQGEKIFRFLRGPGNLEHLKFGINNVYSATKEQLEEIDEQIEELDQENLDKAREGEDFEDTCSFGKSALTINWPSLSSEAGARILELIAQPDLELQDKKLIPVRSDLKFVNDDIFCEWAYVIDLDDDVFEVFGGCVEKADSACKRFDNVGNSRKSVPKLIKSFDLSNLPENEAEFHKALDP